MKPDTPLSEIWDGRINFNDISSSDDGMFLNFYNIFLESEIDALLATAKEIYSSQIPPTAELSRSNAFNVVNTTNVSRFFKNKLVKKLLHKISNI